MKTPRTDEEFTRALSLKSWHEGAEYEAWDWARKLERELAELAAENHRLRIALHEAINRPKGIVPHEAEEFYEQDFYSINTAQQGDVERSNARLNWLLAYHNSTVGTKGLQPLSLKCLDEEFLSYNH